METEKLDFISKYLPNYGRSKKVLACDVLQRFIDDEEVDEKDLDEILGRNRTKFYAAKLLEHLNSELYNKAVAHFNKLKK
jgi:hypothetical protein